MDTRPQAPHRQLAGGALVSFLTQGIGIASSAVAGFVIARVTGVNGIAVFGLSVALLAASTTVFGLDLSAGITFLVSRRAWHPRRAWVTGQRVAVAAGLLGAGAVVLLQQLTQTSLLRGVTLTMALAVGVALPFAIACVYGSAVALATERYETYGLAQTIQAVVSLIAVIVLVVTVGVTGAVIGVAASCVAGWLYLRLRLSRHLPPEQTPHDTDSQVRTAFSFGFRAWGADILQMINYRLDLFVLNAFAAHAIVGPYAVAVSLTALGWVLPSALQTVLFPRAAAEQADASPTAGAATAGAALRHTLVLLTFSSAVLAIVLPVVPVLYGPGFRATIGYGFLLLPGVAAIGFAKPMSAVITGRGYPQYSFYNALMTTPATIALYLTFVPWLGGTGAAIASTLSYTMSMTIAIYYFRRVTGISVLTALRSPRAVIDDYLKASRNLRQYVAMRWSG